MVCPCVVKSNSCGREGFWSEKKSLMNRLRGSQWGESLAESSNRPCNFDSLLRRPDAVTANSPRPLPSSIKIPIRTASASRMVDD